jgi:very-short-patch-repair endonuclease
MIKQEIKETVRNLRKNSTVAEKIFWKAIRNRQINNRKFYRQYVIKIELEDRSERHFFPDFYCHECRLVVEIDGRIHEKKKEYDEFRESFIKSMDLKVIRFTNDEVENDLENVLSRIKQLL